MKLKWTSTGDWYEYECVTHKTILMVGDHSTSIAIYNELNTDWRVCRATIHHIDTTYGFDSYRSLTSVVAWVSDKLQCLGRDITFEDILKSMEDNDA